MNSLDPMFVQAIKEAAKDELLKEEEKNIWNDKGCSKKCILLDELQKTDLVRH
jgi:hypothetical protein